MFPDKMLSSIVIPLPKKKTPVSLDDLNPLVCKIFKKIMKVRLVNYFCEVNLISINKYVFIKGRSTEDELISVTEQVYNSLNKSKSVTGLFLDFKKALDLVNHKYC